MEKELIKLLLRLVYAVKNDMPSILSGIDYEKGDRGVISVKEDMINVSARSVIIEGSKGKLEDYKVRFENDRINVEAWVKMVLRTRVNVDLRVLEFIFNKNEHKVVLAYETLGFSAANALFPQIISNLAGRYPEYIKVAGNRITLELKDSNIAPDFLVVRYLGTEDGVLKIAFLLV